MTTKGPIIRAGIDYRHLLRNSNAGGAATAISTRGPVIANETWATTIDTTNSWTVTVGATGTAAVASVSGVRVLALLAPAISDTALVNHKATLTNPGARAPTASTAIWRTVVMEWEMKLANVASIDNTKFIAGIYSGAAAGRDQNDASGFILASDLLNTLVDNAGTETVTVVSPAPTLTDWNKYKHIIRASTQHEFYVNDVLVDTRTTNLPVTSGLLAAQFYLVSDAAADPRVDIGPVRIWLEE